MIVTRQPDSEHSHWSSKYGTIYTTPRMSNFASSLTTQPGWQGHYSFLPPGETNIFAQPLEQTSHAATTGSDASAERRPASADNVRGAEQSKTSPVVPVMSHSRSMDPLGLRAPKIESPTQEQLESRGEPYGVKSESALEGPLPSIVASPPLESDAVDNRNGNEDPALGKDEDDDVLDDEDDMMEGEDGRPQTAAERTAARRKMKRFRLTHQQTRFLMSEFAKQPHPDAAHRERLSREIPGLSPRQVQVWFQNRRAKIKRLTADDRDRMIKMRAVPDDFDNVQALHSPYGAVHALGTPITPPVDFGNPAAYADHMMRPLMIDGMRRGDGDDHMGPAGLNHGFSGLGFASSGGMGSQDMLSPLSSPAGTERGYYSSHLASPMSNGPRSANPFARHGTMDASMQQQMHAQSRQQQQQVRPLQPLQLRETVSRARSESLQSPLRSSMSWKGDNIDFGYQTGSPSPVMGGRHPSLYQSDQMATSPVGYDSSSYSGSTGMHSPPNQMGYSNLHGTTLQPPPQNRSRLRAASATLPLGLDLRTQYRSVSSGQGPPTSGSALTPRSASTAPYGSSVAYSTSYPSAPLTAPAEYSFPRTPGVSSAHEYSIPSAPIAPPQDFSQALHGASMGSPTSRTPMRDSFGRHAAGDRREEYSQDIYGELKRKRSFGMSPAGHAAAPTSQPYGHSS